MLGGGSDLEALSHQVIGAGVAVHRHLGPGLLESAYQACLAVEFREQQVSYRREVPLRAVSRGTSVDSAYRLDFVVEDRLLVNFNVPRLADGIRRLVHHL